MKPKKATTSKPKLSFTVDRDEVDINSDWVQAVMGPPSPPREAPFFSPKQNNATAAGSTTEVKRDTDADSAAGVKLAGVPDNSTVADNATGEINAALVDDAELSNNSATVDENTAVGNNTAASNNASGVHTATPASAVRPANTAPAPATVTYIAPAEQRTTVAGLSSSRFWKLRPLRRVTDGLTPGQYAVYSLMLTNCEAAEGGEAIYRGGYADLGQLTGLSKRGIQNVIAELQQKCAIRLHTAPGHHRTQTSAYVVPKPEDVLEIWYSRGWRFAVGKSKNLTDGTTVAVSVTKGAA